MDSNGSGRRAPSLEMLHTGYETWSITGLTHGQREQVEQITAGEAPQLQMTRENPNLSGAQGVKRNRRYGSASSKSCENLRKNPGMPPKMPHDEALRIAPYDASAWREGVKNLARSTWGIRYC